jgi:hypothetical protein
MASTDGHRLRRIQRAIANRPEPDDRGHGTRPHRGHQANIQGRRRSPSSRRSVAPRWPPRHQF